jgi:hypothetical protein
MGRGRKRPAPVHNDEDGEPSCSDSEGAAGGLVVARKRFGKSTRGAVSSFFLPQNGGSDRTLADLRMEKFDEFSMRDLVARLPDHNRAAKAAARTRIEAQFGAWWAQWRAGNSLLLYGFGSKREILRRFAEAFASDGACLEVDGLHPGLSARQVLARTAALARLAKPGSVLGSKEDMLDAIRSEGPHRHIYIILHNIDGPGARAANYFLILPVVFSALYFLVVPWFFVEDLF